MVHMSLDEDDLFAARDTVSDEIKLQRAAEAVAEGRVVDHEQVMLWLESLGTDHPRPRPKCGE